MAVVHRAFVEPGRWSMAYAVEKMSAAPARVVGWEPAAIREGAAPEQRGSGLAVLELLRHGVHQLLRHIRIRFWDNLFSNRLMLMP